MTRKKVKLAYISSAAARKATFKKRAEGIIKKVSELTILCGIQACIIIFNPFDSQVEIWKNPTQVRKVIEKYENSSIIDESMNLNQEGFIKQRIAKAHDQLKKLRQENHENELVIDMVKYMKANKLPDYLSIEEVKEIKDFIEKKLKDIKNKK